MRSICIGWLTVMKIPLAHIQCIQFNSVCVWDCLNAHYRIAVVCSPIWSLSVHNYDNNEQLSFSEMRTTHSTWYLFYGRAFNYSNVGQWWWFLHLFNDLSHRRQRQPIKCKQFEQEVKMWMWKFSIGDCANAWMWMDCVINGTANNTNNLNKNI